MAIIVNHRFIEKLLKQIKLINKSSANRLPSAFCKWRIGKIIFYIICSMFDVQIISVHVYIQSRPQMRLIVDISGGSKGPQGAMRPKR